MIFYKNAKIDPEKIHELMKERKNQLKIKQGERVELSCIYREKSLDFKLIFENTEEIIKKLK